jgi:Holliday junction resolvase RusA-like endonuclease
MIYAVPFPPPKPAAIPMVADPGAVTFVVEGQPIPKERHRMSNGHAYTPPRTRNWETAVAWCARIAMGPKKPLAGDLVVTLEFRRKGKLRADLDNISKAVLDSGNGVIWTDDKQVIELHARVRYDSDDPCVTVTVKPAV